MKKENVKSLKVIALFVVMIFLYIINIGDFQDSNLRNIIFMILGGATWFACIPNIKEASKARKIASIVFIILFLIMGNLMVNWKRGYPFEKWDRKVWLLIPIVLFIAGKIVNLKYLAEKIENSNKKIIITYVIALVVVSAIVIAIEHIILAIEFDDLENVADFSRGYDYLGILSSALFIYQLYRFLNITLDINAINIISVFIAAIIFIAIGISQHQTISKYTESAENLKSLVDSGRLTYSNINTEFDSKVVEHHAASDSDYYDNRVFALTSVAREWDYACIVGMYQSGNRHSTKSNFNALMQDYRNLSVWESYIETNDECSTFIIVNMIAATIETVLLLGLSLGKRNANA